MVTIEERKKLAAQQYALDKCQDDTNIYLEEMELLKDGWNNFRKSLKAIKV